MSPKFGDSHSLKHYTPELLACVIFDTYNQHTQINTKLDVKLNKWHITIEKLYRKPTETEQNFKKNYDPTVGSNRKPKTHQVIAITLRHQATVPQSGHALLTQVGSMYS